MINSEKYWEERYKDRNTGWDMQEVSPPLKAYFNQLENKDQKILLPGAGNAYEAEYLFKQGFNKVYIADIAETPLYNFTQRVPDFPEKQLLHLDFFNIQENFDLVIEQTFFCALPPNLRKEYSLKLHDILNSRGLASGLLFDFPLTEVGPPFGGDAEEYLSYFEPFFEIKTLERCYNSHPQRQGKELFFQFVKK